MAMQQPESGSQSGQRRMRGQMDRGKMSNGRGVGCRPRQDTGTEQLETFLEQPKLVITEQPKQRGMRFRYECEGRSAGSILGASTNEQNKTLPTIEIQGNMQNIKKVKVTTSLVTKDIPYRPHPHGLVGKDCNDGICMVTINPRTNRKHSFSNLGIQCVRRKEVDPALEKRRSQGIDPFNSGHSKSIEDIEMNVVRLCFQCEVERMDGGKFPLSPIISEPIFDKKATTTSELKINRLNVVRGSCTGKTEIYLLCDKVQKDDIEIIFSLGEWEAKAEFAQTDVHRQIAIVFKAPPFRDLDLQEEVEVNVQLRRLSDHMQSESVKYTYLPHNPDPYEVNRKRKIAKSMFKEKHGVPVFNEQENSAPQLFCQFPFSAADSTSQAPAVEVSPADPGSFMEEINFPFKMEDALSVGSDMPYNDLKLAGENLIPEHTLTSLVQILEMDPHQSYSNIDFMINNAGSSFTPLRFDEEQNSHYCLTDMDQNCNTLRTTLNAELGQGYSDAHHMHDYNAMLNGNPQSFLEQIEGTLDLGAQDHRFSQCDNESQAVSAIKSEIHEGH
ncbi:transcription factor RelB [Amia ocellicauda]|uniref:transcription factor RelB n=1 Tax=Amia ocellicauda TaxID=2972642 RepID=UPI00346408E7